MCFGKLHSTFVPQIILKHKNSVSRSFILYTRLFVCVFMHASFGARNGPEHVLTRLVMLRICPVKCSNVSVNSGVGERSVCRCAGVSVGFMPLLKVWNHLEVHFMRQSFFNCHFMH